MHPHPREWTRLSAALPAAICVAAVILLGGCAAGDWDPTQKVGEPKGHLIDPDRARRMREARTAGYESSISLTGSDTGRKPDSVKRGSGRFVRATPARTHGGSGSYNLNLEGEDIRTAVKIILGELLNENYVLDPAVQGTVTIKIDRGISRDMLLPTLETLLRMNNATLVRTANGYEVVPVTGAVQGRVVPQLGDSRRPLPEGYSVQVVPLKYIGADEMSQILTPLVPEGSLVRVDNLRNLLILAGTGPEMGNILDTVDVFDVDWMAGLSVGFFNLEYAKAADVATQLETLLADDNGNPFKGLFRFIPVESANSLLVVSPQSKYLSQVEQWIDRLDQAEASGAGASRLYVYRVKNGDAENLADVLTKLFSEGGTSTRARALGGVAPGIRQNEIGSGPGGEATSSPGGTTAARHASASTITLSSDVSIVADAVNNSLLVRSSPRDYKKILDTLKQLDIVPLQVLIEATVIEVRLTGNLQYGVQWQFFSKTNAYKHDFSLDGVLDSAVESGLGTAFPGFNWVVSSSPNRIRATLSALAGDNLVNVLSSPSVLVLDNQTAEMKVVQEVPVATAQRQGDNAGDSLRNEISYREAGVVLNVKPRVTPGGLVQMEIEQEVSTVVNTDSSNIDSPTFQVRNIKSNVAVRSSQAVVLGGLIQDTRSKGQQGLPGLYAVPIIGALFGETTKNSDRTELIVVLTPRVIGSDADVESVTDDFRRRLKGLEFKF